MVNFHSPTHVCFITHIPSVKLSFILNWHFFIWWSCSIDIISWFHLLIIFKTQSQEHYLLLTINFDHECKKVTTLCLPSIYCKPSIHSSINHSFILPSIYSSIHPSVDLSIHQFIYLPLNSLILHSLLHIHVVGATRFNTSTMMDWFVHVVSPTHQDVYFWCKSTWGRLDQTAINNVRLPRIGKA